MSRINLLLVALVAALGGALAMFLLNPDAPAGSADEAQIRAIADQVVTERLKALDLQASPPVAGPEAPPAVAEISPEQINPLIENFLMQDPKILQRVSEALQAQLDQEKRDQARLSLANLSTDIYDDPDHVVLGNPDGDVTLVEFFDYNCGFCRRAMPDMARLLEEDKNLRIILKEFPILSQDSVEAARIAVSVAATPGADYWAFHEALFTTRGQISGQTALDAAAAMGLDPAELEQNSRSEQVTKVLQRNYELAQALDIGGTPAYVLGDEIIAGAVGYDALSQSIANLRECGSTTCGT